MNIELRDPNTIMKLSRLGSFHQSKLSFLRSFLNEFKIGIIQGIYLILIKMDMAKLYILLKKEIEFIR
jgi:hypothetical protein